MMIQKPSIDGHRLELERIKIHDRICRAWKAKGYSWTSEQAEKATDAELLRIYPPIARQQTLPGMPTEPEAAAESCEPSTKVMALKSIERKYGKRRQQVYDLLDQAGAHGMTREELAEAIGVKEGGVTQTVRDLLDAREACEAFKRLSRAKEKVWVIVLAKHWRPA